MDVQITVIVVIVHVAFDVNVDAADRIHDLLRPNGTDCNRRIDVGAGHRPDHLRRERRAADAIGRVELLVAVPGNCDPRVTRNRDKRCYALVQIEMRQKNRIGVAFVCLNAENEKVETTLMKRRCKIALREMYRYRLHERVAQLMEREKPGHKSNHKSGHERRAQCQRSRTHRAADSPSPRNSPALHPTRYYAECALTKSVSRVSWY